MLEAPDDSAKPAVRAAIAVLWSLMVLVTLRILWTSRRLLCAPPSLLAASGTRWCKAGGARRHNRQRAFLFAYRFLVALYQLAVLSALIFGSYHPDALAKKHPAFQFLFFTVWNYILQTIFWVVAAATSAAALCSASGPSALLRCATHSLLSVCLPMSLLVSVVLWTVLFPDAIRKHRPEVDLNFFSYSMHALNTLLLFFEFFLDRMLLQRAALGLLLSWALLYAAFSWVQNAFTGLWPYFFLRLDSWAALPWYAAVAALNLVFWAVVRLLSVCKARCNPSLVEGAAGAGLMAPTDAEGLVSSVLTPPPPPM